MRGPRTAVIAAVVVTAASATILNAQQRLAGPATATDGATSAAAAPDPSLRTRSARQLLRNGLDYLDNYGDCDRALVYLAEAARRPADDLDADEAKQLKDGVDRARRGLREVNPNELAVAPRRAVRPGAFALAPSRRRSRETPADAVQLASAEAAPASASPVAAPAPAAPAEPPPLEMPPLRPSADATVAVEPPLPDAPRVADAGPAKVEATKPEAPKDAPIPADAPPPAEPIFLTGSTPEAASPPPADAPVAPKVPAPADAPAPAPIPAPAEMPSEPPSLPAELPPSTPESLPALPPDVAPARAEAPAPKPVDAPAPVADAPPAMPVAEPPPASTPAPAPSGVPANVPSDIPWPTPARGGVSSPRPQTPEAPRRFLSDPRTVPAADPAPAPAPIPAAVPAPADAPADIPAPAPAPSVPAPAPPAEEADALPPLPIPTPRRAAAPAPSPADTVAAMEAAAAPPESRLSPDSLREIEEIARRQDDAARRNPLPTLGNTTAPDSRSSGSTDPNSGSRLELPRAPSPTEPRPIRVIPVPEEFTPLPPRQWEPNRKYWAAAATCHMPLYFQDAVLERYGQGVEQSLGTAGRYFSYPLDDPKQSNQRNQILQPMFSAGLFIGQIAMLPYNLVVDPPWEAEYDLGYYRPGDRVPPDTIYLPKTGIGPPLRGRNY